MSAYFGQLPINGMMYNGRECSAMYNGNVIWPTEEPIEGMRWSACGGTTGSGFGVVDPIASPTTAGWSATATSLLATPTSPQGLSGASGSYSGRFYAFNAQNTSNKFYKYKGHRKIWISYSANWRPDSYTLGSNSASAFMLPSALLSGASGMQYTSVYSGESGTAVSGYLSNYPDQVRLVITAESGFFNSPNWSWSTTVYSADAISNRPTFISKWGVDNIQRIYLSSTWSASGIMIP